jgi:polysaccharide export outer membrane protein
MVDAYEGADILTSVVWGQLMAWGRMSMRALLVALLFFCGFATNAIAQLEPLHAGDSIQISVWQDPKLDRTVIIGPDGMISFPLAGHIKAGGMTPEALEGVLRSRLQKNYTGQLDVTVALASVNREEEAERSPKVYVTGEVLRPGPYVIKPAINVMQAIALAGGLGPFAAKQRVQLHRKINGVDSIFIFDFNAFASGRDAVDNINLRSGDIIIVPERGLLE